MTSVPRPTEQPYPRTERCAVCGEYDTLVVSPADWAVCWRCDLELKSEEPGPTLSELLRYEDELRRVGPPEDRPRAADGRDGG